MMKKGKEIKMAKSYDNYKVVCGTVDSKNPTSVYISISAWGEPTEEDTNHYVSVISGLYKELKRFVYNSLPITYNKNRTIIDLDIRESGISYGKRSFMNCELTLYQSNWGGKILMSGELKKSMGEITDKIITEVFDENQHFKFYKKKK